MPDTISVTVELVVVVEVELDAVGATMESVEGRRSVGKNNPPVAVIRGGAVEGVGTGRYGIPSLIPSVSGGGNDNPSLIASLTRANDDAQRGT